MLILDNITHLFSQGKLILDEASCKINPGERVGLVGPNGAGKSTLFNIITGQLEPHSGQVHYGKGLRIGYLRQEPSGSGDTAKGVLHYCLDSFDEINALENKLHQIENEMLNVEPGSEMDALLEEHGHLQHQFEVAGGYRIRHEIEACLSGLGFKTEDFEKPFGEFSGGWQMRAELARILVVRPDLLLLDEPTNYLDVEAVEWLREFLRKFEGTLLLISHDRYLLNTLTTSTAVLMNGKLRKFAGSYDQFLKSFEQEAVSLEAAKRNQDRKKAQLEKFITQFKAKATKAAQARSKQRELDRMEDIEVPQTAFKAPKITLADPPHVGHDLISLDGVSKTYDGSRWIYEGLEISIKNGEKIAFVGWNGVGKTTLLRILAGTLEFEKGDRKIANKALVGYHSQEYVETMASETTVWDTVRAIAKDMNDSQVRGLLGSFRFSGDDINKTVGMLSGGEKVRLSFCRMLANPPNLLILDEPTAHLDIGTRQSLENALKEFSGSICMVSHDIEFIRSIAQEVIEVTPNKLTRFFGDYDYYRMKKRELMEEGEKAYESTGGENVTLKSSSKSESSEEKIGRKEQRRLAAERRKELNKIKKPLEKRIEAAEKKLEELESEEKVLWDELSKGPAPEDLKRMNQRLAAIGQEKEQCDSEWEEASMELEELMESIEE